MAGDSGHPWIWCTKCGAYTNKSVRKLQKPCKGRGNMHYVKQLAAGIEPHRQDHLHKVPKPTEDETRKMELLLETTFRKPVATTHECKEVVWASYHQHHNTRRKGNSIWKTIAQTYNARVVPEIRANLASIKQLFREVRNDKQGNKKS